VCFSDRDVGVDRANIEHSLVLPANDLGHALRRGKLFVGDPEHRDGAADFAEELVVRRVEVAEVLDGDPRLAVAAARPDPRERLLGGHVEVHNQVRLAHEVGHVVEQRNVRVKVALVHQTGVLEHPGKDKVLVHGPVVD
jgi:hypothetical protein